MKKLAFLGWLVVSMLVPSLCLAGNVGTADILDGAVTAAKIADGAVTTTKTADGAVTTTKIADGAVTDAKISGQISASKISYTGLDADTLDGMDSSSFATLLDLNGVQSELNLKSDINHSHAGYAQTSHTHDVSDIISGMIDVDKIKTYSNVKIVHKGPYDGINTFQSIEEAMSSVGYPNESNRVLIFVMPGTYDVNNLTVKKYVDIVGVNKKSVILKSSGQNYVLTLSNNSTISNITINSEWIGIFDTYQFTTGPIGINNCDVIVNSLPSSYGTGIYLIYNPVQLENVYVEINNPSFTYLGWGIKLEISNDELDKQWLKNVKVAGNPGTGMSVSSSSSSSTGVFEASNVSVTIDGPHGLGWSGLNTNLNNLYVRTEPTSGYTETGLSVGGNGVINCSNCNITTLYGSANINVHNSIIVRDVNPERGYVSGIKIANSKVSGSLNLNEWGGSGTVKSVNNFDSNYNPIANGEY